MRAADAEDFLPESVGFTTMNPQRETLAEPWSPGYFPKIGSARSGAQLAHPP
jgi:hypothetical protein